MRNHLKIVTVLEEKITMLCFLCVIFLSMRRGERKCYRSAGLTKKGGAREYWICVWTIHLRIGFGDEGKKERMKGKL